MDLRWDAIDFERNTISIHCTETGCTYGKTADCGAVLRGLSLDGPQDSNPKKKGEMIRTRHVIRRKNGGAGGIRTHEQLPVT